MQEIKPIAIYLPQFHPTPENDKWWGKGFTEWTNVTKATPRFEGHYQPHLPADLGFYDLRLEEARLAQEQMAKKYGIYGFCYYHYWFNGKKMLHEPLERKLKNPKEDFPFMLCWANENWTRKWDGGDNKILLNQEYSEIDDVNHINELIPIFKDSRYIKINGRPVFCIYRSTLFPDIKKTIKIWREECKKHNLELFICRFETFGTFGKHHLEDAFDAGVEFQPHSEHMDEFKLATLLKQSKTLSYRIKYRFNSFFNKHQNNKIMRENVLNILEYNDYVDYLLSNYKTTKDYVYFPGVTPSWDNSARNKKNPFIFTNSSPSKFKEWFLFQIKNLKKSNLEENFIFINAWNEWAEGNHLEPCQKWGTQYLEKIKEALIENK